MSVLESGVDRIVVSLIRGRIRFGVKIMTFLEKPAVPGEGYGCRGEVFASKVPHVWLGLTAIGYNDSHD